MKQIQYSNRSGITLLEVLISIGILAIGIVSTLALMPAGGSYLRRAKIENHSAALVHNAYNTATAAGLFREDALFMPDKIQNADDRETLKRGFPESWDAFTAKPGTEQIYLSSNVNYYDYETSPKLSNDSPIVLMEDQEQTITLTMTVIGQAGLPTVGQPPDVITEPLIPIEPDDDDWSDGKDFRWELTPDLDLDAANKFSVNAAGDPTNWNENYYDEWSFEAEHDELGSLGVQVEPPENSTRESDDSGADGYRRYFARPYKVNMSGDATLGTILSDTVNSQFTGNQTASEATQLTFNNAAFNKFRVAGELWRYQTGYRDGSYTLQWDLPDEFTEKLMPNNGDRGWVNAGSLGAWTDSSGTPKADNNPDGVKEDTVDWFTTRVRSGTEVIIDTTRMDEDVFNNSLKREQGLDNDVYKFAVFLNATNGLPLDPELGSTERRATYKIEQAGRLYVKVQLKSGLLDPNDFTVLINDPDYDALTHEPYRLNTVQSGLVGFNPVPGYEFDLEIVGNTRIVAYDPLMRSHLRSIGAGDDTMSTFARFDQLDDNDQPAVLDIPRANWRKVEEASPDIGVALANRLCRQDDTVRVKMPDDEDLPSEQLFDALLDDNGNVNTLARRQSTGDMSWMMTVQPAAADAIPLKAHWKSGNFIDVAFIIFDKRFMPLLPTETDGARDFLGSWSELTGTLDVQIPVNSNLEVADLERMFPSYGWLMLGPKRFRDNQKIDWIQIHTCEFSTDANGVIHASILPVNEPMPEAMNEKSLTDADGNEQVWVHVEQGITAVSRRFIQIE